MQSSNKPQASKTFGWVEDFLNTYTLYPGGVPGNTYFVDSGHTNASDGNDGLSKDTPRAQIESCFTVATRLVTANNGDIIYAMPGHEETVDAAGDLDLDVAGVTIIFLGEGEAQAQITLGTTSTADVDIDAANITLVRPKFVAEVDALTGPIDVNAADFRIVNGQYRDGTAIDTTDCIVATSNATRLKIHGWRYLPGNQAGTEKESNIQLNGVDNVELFDIYIAGSFNAACIENVTDEILNVHMKDIVLNNTDTDPSPGMVLDSNCDGIAERVLVRIASGTTYVSDVSDINWYESYGTGTDGTTFDDPIPPGIATGLEGLIGGAEDTQTDSLHGKIGTDTEMTDNSLFDLLGAGTTTLSLSAAIGADVDDTQTDTLHGKIGTDVEMTDNSLFDLLGAGTTTLSLSAAIGSDVDDTQTDTLHGKIGTDTEMTDNSLFDLLGAGTTTLSLSAAIGSDVNDTQTDTLHGKIGTDTEMTDNSLFDLLGAGTTTLSLSAAIGSDVDDTQTDTLHGKIGTDTEMTDNSLFDLLGAGTTTLSLSAAIGADVDDTQTDTLHGKIGTDTELADNSLYDLIGAGAKTTALIDSTGRFVSKNIDLSSAHGSGASPVTEFNVTGDVLVRAVGCVATSLSSTGDDGTISLGVSDNVAAIIPKATVDGVSLVAGDVWFDATSGTKAGGLPDDGAWVAIAGGANIVMTITTASMDGGNVNVYVQWIPLSSNGNVAAA